jgi:hypothetical protein
MKLLPGIGLNSGRRMVLLAPFGANIQNFRRANLNQRQYGALLAETQRFRGRVYVAEGNLSTSDLSVDGRHVQAADYAAWHLVTLDAAGAVMACGRVLVHDEGVRFRDMTMSHSALARSSAWGELFESAVEAEIQKARTLGVRVAELGGWAVSRTLRCTTEAVRMLVAGYALAQLLGGVLGISTVDLNRSGSILRRMGGSRLVYGGVELPSYYEPQYRADIEILRFDSARPNERYVSRIRDCASELSTMPVYAGSSAAVEWETPAFEPAVAAASRAGIPLLPMISQPAVA